MIEGRYVWNSENCLEVQNGLEKIVFHQKLIKKVERNETPISSSEFKQQLLFNWQVEEPIINSYAQLPNPRVAAVSSVFGSGVPFALIKEWNEFALLSLFDGLLIGGSVYGIAIENNAGMAVSFVTLDILLRFWGSGKVFSRIRDRQNTKHRIDVAEENNCVITK